MRKYIIVLILIVVIFSGLNNLKELTSIAIVKTIGLDLDEEGNIEATVIVIDTKSEEEDSSIIYESKGSSVQETLRKIVDKSPKRLYAGHVETLVVSEDIAKEKLKESLDFFIRDNEGSNNFSLTIAKGSKAKDIVTIINDEKISFMELLLSSVKYRGNSNTDTLNDLIKQILKKGEEICVSTCYIEDEKLTIGPMAYFSSWNMQGFLDDRESIIYNLLENNVKNAIIPVNENEDLIVLEITSSKTKLSLKDNIVTIKLDIKANVSETGENVVIESVEDVNKVNEIVRKNLEVEIEEFLNKYDNNLIGVGNLLYRKKSKYNTNDVKKNVEVKIEILNQGGVIKKW